MPDRILRDELLTSDRWLRLGGKDLGVGNARRLAFVACISTADTLGNMEATGTRLERLWRDFGISDDEAIDATLADFARVDLARVYQDEAGKRFLHLPRYGQRLRYLGRLCPLSPWTSDEEKQEITKKSPGANPVPTMSAPGAHQAPTGETQARTGPSPDEVSRSEEKLNRKEGEGKRSEDDYAHATAFVAVADRLGLKPKTGAEKNPPAKPNGNSKPDDWWLTSASIARKGEELGLKPEYRESDRHYKDRIFKVLHHGKGEP